MVSRRIVITYDVSAITKPDEADVDALARLQLAARRSGASIVLRNATPALVDVLTAAGLAAALGVDVDRQAEQGERLGTDEEVDRGDDAL